MVTALFSSLLITIAWVSLHLLLMHKRPCSHRLSAMTKGFLLSLPLLFLFLFFLQHQPTLVLKLNGHEAPLMAYIYAFLLQLLFFFFFVECFYHVERSVTLRLLIEIQEAKTSLKIEEVIEDYSLDEMILRRLNDLLTHEWVRKKGDHWGLTTKGQCLAKIMRFSCWLFQSHPQNERL